MLFGLNKVDSAGIAKYLTRRMRLSYLMCPICKAAVLILRDPANTMFAHMLRYHKGYMDRRNYLRDVTTA